MSDERAETFHFLDGPPQIKAIKLESNRLESCLAHYREHALRLVAIAPISGFTGSDLEFFRDHAYVRGVDLCLAGAIDIRGLRHLKNLEYLKIDGNNQALDLTQFPLLETLYVDWHPRLTITSSCSALRRLTLRKYKPKSGDLSELADLPLVRDLAIVQSPIRSIEGIQRYHGLHRLELSYLPKLQSIDSLAELRAPDLARLELLNCPRITNHAVVRHLPSLRVLRFNVCGAIPNLAFVRELPLLEELRFVDTNIVDGDLAPCLSLERVGFMNKKHYSHTVRQVMTHIGGEELAYYTRMHPPRGAARRPSTSDSGDVGA